MLKHEKRNIKEKYNTIKARAIAGEYDTQIIITLIIAAVLGSISAVYVWEWFKRWLQQ